MTRYQIVDHQVSSQVGSEVVILELNEGMYFGLNPVGARIWQLLASPQSLDELCRSISLEFAVEADACRPDILTLLDQMVDHGLIRTDPPAPGRTEQAASAR